MMDWNGGWGWLWMMPMTFLWIVLIGAVVYAAVRLARRDSQQR